MKSTNSSWRSDTTQIHAQLNDISLHVINDFAAIGYAVPTLKGSDHRQLGGKQRDDYKPIAVLGPGTGLGLGLGLCTVIPRKNGPVVIEAEGGHADFAPVDAQEIKVLKILQQQFGRVCYERLLSGADILSIYQALAKFAKRQAVHELPEEGYQAVIGGGDSPAMKTLQLFCRVLGSFAGNVALTLGAKGSVFIAEGIARKILSIQELSGFRSRFESKGRPRSFLADIPVYVVTAEDIGLQGAAIYLANNPPKHS